MTEDAKAYNDYCSAAVDLSDGHVASNGIFTVVRSVRDIDNNKNRRYLYSSYLPPAVDNDDNDDKGGEITMMMPPMPPPVECHESIQWRLPSPSGAKVAILRLEGDGDATANNQKRQILEIWGDHGHSLQRRIHLSSKQSQQQHGKVISDPGGFGRPVWNVQETAIVYMAERKAPGTISFFDDDDEEVVDVNEEDSTSAAPKTPRKVRGAQNVLNMGKMEHWGEKYVDQSPILDLFCVHVETGNVARVLNVPGSVKVDRGEAKRRSSISNNTYGHDGGYSLGQPVFAPDGSSIVYVGWDAGGGSEMPRRLGLIYCQQRPSKVYQSSIANLMQQISSDDGTTVDVKDDTDFEVLTPTFRLARSPRFSPINADGHSTLVILGSDTGFDTHGGCYALYAMDWKGGALSLDSTRSVVHQVWDPRNSDPKAGTVSGLRFPGLFLQQLPEDCFIAPEHLLITTQWGSSSKVVRVSLHKDDNSPVALVQCAGANEASSQSLLCTTRDGAAVIRNEFSNQPASLLLIPNKVLLSDTLSQEFAASREFERMKSIASTRFSPPSSKLSAFTCHIYMHDVPPAVTGVDFDLPVQSILLLPASSDATKKPPLVVVPHGGPHSVSSTTYLPSYAFLCGHGGYAVLLINYRGSTGFGKGYIQVLPTRIGDVDVNDVMAVTQRVKESGLVDPDRVGICGGSHGGFLTAHCTSQHPDFFKAAVMRNPVVNIASMTTATDIPDWCFVEVCGTYDWSTYRPPTTGELMAMREKSPICRVANVKAPTLVALGMKDLRVPPSQGLEWYHTLRSMGIPTKLLMYDNDVHAIAGVQSEADHWIHIKQWFDRYL